MSVIILLGSASICILCVFTYYSYWVSDGETFYYDEFDRWFRSVDTGGDASFVFKFTDFKKNLLIFIFFFFLTTLIMQIW